MNVSYLDIAKMFDHALLLPTLTTDELEAGCRMAATYNVASVRITPYAVKRWRELLTGSTVKTCTVIGIPQGGNTTAIKHPKQLRRKPMVAKKWTWCSISRRCSAAIGAMCAFDPIDAGTVPEVDSYSHPWTNSVLRKVGQCLLESFDLVLEQCIGFIQAGQSTVPAHEFHMRCRHLGGLGSKVRRRALDSVRQTPHFDHVLPPNGFAKRRHGR